MLIDSHLHVGQYYNQYFSPEDINSLAKAVGIDYYIVSSTTQCEENYAKVILEFQELIRLAGENVLPVMWITPEGLKGSIAWYFESEIKWRALKIHPFLHKTEWMPGKGLIEEVIDIAMELQLPIIIHTGDDDCCQAGVFESIVKDFPGVIFILAHGRPLNHALRIVQRHENAFVDSAFMPITEMIAFINADLSHKLLWGTDMCIPKYFNLSLNMVEYYNTKLKALRNSCSEEIYDCITSVNAKKLFCIKTAN